MPVGPHFLVAPGALDGATLTLTGADGHHLARVLRASPGDPLSLADGAGVRAVGRVRHVDGDAVALALSERSVESRPVPQVTVVHALPKGRKLDDVVQRLTEVGVTRLVPVHSTRSEVRLDGDRATKARRRWQAVAHAAAKQSRRARILEVDEVGHWPGPLAGHPGAVVLWEEATVPLRQVLKGYERAEEIVLGIGPEGGLTADEAAAAPAARLGATILRTETAALVGVTAALTLLGRFA